MNCLFKNFRRDLWNTTSHYPTWRSLLEMGFQSRAGDRPALWHGFIWRFDSCHPCRTPAWSAFGSWSAEAQDRPSSRCSPADGDLTSGCTPLRTTAGDHRGNSLRFSLKLGPQRPTCLSCAHLVVCELAVLQVCILQSSDAGVRVVEGVFAYAVWEAFLEERENITLCKKNSGEVDGKMHYVIVEPFLLLQRTIVWRTFFHYKGSFVQ